MIPSRLRFLSNEEIERIYTAGLEVLQTCGVKSFHDGLIELFDNSGLEVDKDKKIAKIDEGTVKESLKKAPKEVKLYTLDGKRSLDLSGDNVYFVPGSMGIKLIEGKKARTPTLKDAAEFVKLTETLENIDLNTAPLYPGDVPPIIFDRYRVYISLKYSNKPFWGGAFSDDGPVDMWRMIVAVLGDEEEAKKRPRWAMSACPSPPLKWSKTIAQNLIDAARRSVPVWFVSMPQTGATSPATIASAIVLHTAETLSGIVITQLVNPGAPVIYGGSPIAFDLKTGYVALGSVETTLISCGYAEIGKYLGLPTHGYVGCSDSKTVDAQAGLETGLNSAIAAAARINVIASAGMLESESGQSFEKLVIDNDILGQIRRLLSGINASEEALQLDIIKRVGAGGDYTKDSTALRAALKWFAREYLLPTVIDRKDRKAWEEDGSKDIVERARELMKKRLAEYEPPRIVTPDVDKQLISIIREAAKRYGVEAPEPP